MQNTDICVIGGGLSGLATALKLSEHGYKVTVLEKEPILGGLAKSFFINNLWIPETYHHINKKEDILLDYIKKLGFSANLKWQKVKTAFWYNNKPYSLSGPLDILKFKPLSLKSKVSLFKLGLYSYIKKNYHDLNDVSAEDWLSKIIDPALMKNLFLDLATIKYNSLKEASAAWVAEMMHEAARVRENYAYLDCGLQKFIDEIGVLIKKHGGQILLNTEALKISGNKIYYIDRKNKRREVLSAGIIISSIPPPILNKITDSKSPELGAVKYTPSVCVCIGAQENISSYYWNILIKPKYSFDGFFKYSQLYPEITKNGEHLYYFFKYNVTEVNVDLIIEDINKITSFQPLWINKVEIPYSTPLFSIGYNNLPIHFSDNIFLTGVYREFPSPRTMNAALKSGIKTADFIIKKKEI